MDLKQAVQSLLNGKKVTRESWIGSLYFTYEKGNIKCYQPSYTYFVYDEDILISDGYIVEGTEDGLSFCDMLPYLIQGNKVTKEGWEEIGYRYLLYSPNEERIILYYDEEIEYVPHFEAFIATDWIEI